MTSGSLWGPGLQGNRSSCGLKGQSITPSDVQHPAVPVASGEIRGSWGDWAMGTSLLRAKRGSRSWRTSWDDQELRCKWWRYHLWPPTESCSHDSSPGAGRNVACRAWKWTGSSQGEKICHGGDLSRAFIPAVSLSTLACLFLEKIRKLCVKPVTFFISVSDTPTGKIFRFPG